jgi:serine/threonine protein kinase
MSKLLSQGSFGCVYYPALTCKGQPDTDRTFISKLQKKDFNSDNEKMIGKRVQQIPNYSNFFIPILSDCDVNISEIDSKDINKCNVITKNTDFDFELLRMRYVKSELIFSFLEREKNPRQILFNIIELYTYLLHSIEKLVDHKLVQFDLKNDNILFDLRRNVPLIIDFGISLDMTKLFDPIQRNKYLSQYFYVFAPQYYVWPIEVHLINYLVHRKQVADTEAITSICKEYVKNNRGLDIFSAGFKVIYRKQAEKYLSRFVGKTRDEVLNQVLPYFKTWDNYSLSIMYLRILFVVFDGGIPNNRFIKHFSQLLAMNVHPNPEKRKSIKNSLQLFHKLFYNSEDPNNYISLLKNFSFDKKYVMKTIKTDNATLNKLIY